MPRTRSIKPEFWDDEKLARVSRGARFVFVGLWTCSDDYGVTKGNASWLKSQLFPYDADLSVDEFSGWIAELESIGRIVPYTVEDEKYYYIKHFNDHQKVDHPSRIKNPSPPDGILVKHSRGLASDSREIRDETETETETISYVGQPAADPPDSTGGKAVQVVEANPNNGAVPYARVMQLFNEILGDELPNCKNVTDERKRAIKARWNTDDQTCVIDWWERYFKHIRESKFLMGRSPPKGGHQPFQATFDWVLVKRNFVKIREGNYHRD